MTTITKIAAVAAAAGALANQASGQFVSGFTANQDQLLLGITSPSSTTDLVIDLGTATQAGVGGGTTLDLNLNGNTGLTAAGLQSEITSLFGGMSGLEFGVVGGHNVNVNNNAIYSTVPDGSGAPVLGAVGTLNSAANTVGQGLNDFGTGNQAQIPNNQGYGESWGEEVGSPTSLWQKNGTSPMVGTPASFTSGYAVADLYGKVNGTTVEEGTVTLGSDGSLFFTPSVVPEPDAFTLAGLGAAALLIRRRGATRL